MSISNLFCLTGEQMARLEPFLAKSEEDQKTILWAVFPTTGRSRVDDRRVLSGIIFVNRNGLRWRDAPREYDPAKALCNRWKQWSGMGVFARIMEEGLASEAAAQKTIMIDATYLIAHRTASSLRLKRCKGLLRPDDSALIQSDM